MNMYKCRHCGVFYKDPDHDATYVCKLIKRNEQIGLTAELLVNLCPDCSKKLEEWIEGNDETGGNE